MRVQALEEARAIRELRLQELQRHNDEMASISTVAPAGPTSKDILRAIQTAVKDSHGNDRPLSLMLFADSLLHDERVSVLLKADSEVQKKGAIEAVEALNHALGSPQEPLSHSVIIDLFFSPEAETEKLLASMQRGRSGEQWPSWRLDKRAQNKALATLESSLAAKLALFSKREPTMSQELVQVRAALSERDAEEKQEMELFAASASAQRERTAVKLQQKAQLQRNKVLRQRAQDARASSVATDSHNTQASLPRTGAIAIK